MTTIEQHSEAVARLIDELGAQLPEASRRVDASSVAARPQRYAARVIAAEVRAALDVPLFDNSQMDGFAVRAAEVGDASAADPTVLPVGEPIAAGDAPSELPPGVARPVMTGAPIPLGADAVVPVERTAAGRFDVAKVTITAPLEPGVFVRRRAIDVAEGALLASAGEPLRLAQLGAFAAAGVAEVSLRRRLRVAVITTGDELAEPGAVGAAAAPGTATGTPSGKIPDAIAGMLCAAIRQAGAKARAVRCPSDDPTRLTETIEAQRGWADLIITVGGISKGAYEVVKLALAPRGIVFDHVAMQPGGPQGIGRLSSDADRAAAHPTGAGRPGTAVLCFPGNPVSALISFEAFLREPLRRLAGLRPAPRRTERLRLAEPLDSPAHQHQLRRGTVLPDARVRPLGGPGSHLIAHYGAADAIIHVPVGTTRLEADDEAEVWLIDD